MAIDEGSCSNKSRASQQHWKERLCELIETGFQKIDNDLAEIKSLISEQTSNSDTSNSKIFLLNYQPQPASTAEELTENVNKTTVSYSYEFEKRYYQNKVL